jgi:hypothetical protein
MAEVEQLTTPAPPEVHSVDPQDQGSLVDDVILGGEAEAFTEAFEEQTEEVASPQLPEQEPSVEVTQDNNEVRYQYWQSQADKLKNERDQLQQQFNSLATQQQAPQQQEPEPEAEPEIEFPDPPEKPKQPYNFSMDEAMSDPSSESAKYVQEEQGWRDEMDNYKNMQFEYQMAMMEDERNQLRTERQADIQRREAEQEQATQMSNVKQHVMNEYKVDDQVAEDFVRVMSDPQSINIDNLWKLYASGKGYSSPQQPVATPSGEFQQVKRAQQIPPSMGVMPSQNRQNEGSIEDKIMDSMITDYGKQNPWD